MNTFGRILRLTTFGESHGAAVGGVLDGCPAGLHIDIDALQRFVGLRRAGATSGSTSRKEADRPEILSGVFEGCTLGTPIAFMVRSSDARPEDYAELREAYRPSHADYTYEAKYGRRDYRGGGRASARETVARMVGGGIAIQLLEKAGVAVQAWTSAIGAVGAKVEGVPPRESVYGSALRCPDMEASAVMQREIEAARCDGDTLGGIVECVATGVPAGLGAPVGDKLESALGAAMLSLPAAHAFEYGSGMAGCRMRGSEQNDIWMAGNHVRTLRNNSGGIQGGISNGMPIVFRVGFKPIATLGRGVELLSSEGELKPMLRSGRHDVCAVPRAVPLVEAMAALVLADAWLASRLDRL